MERELQRKTNDSESHTTEMFCGECSEPVEHSGTYRALCPNCGSIRIIDTVRADGSGGLETDRDDVRLRVSDDGPILELGDSKILLRTFLNVADEDDFLGMGDVPLRTELDSDGDNGSWWNLVPEDADSQYPWLSIQPEVITDESGEVDR